MIGRFLDFCIRERFILLAVMIAAVACGWYAFRSVPLDAIPNVGENQVIVLTEWMGRSPKDIEDQITYPLSIALQSVPGAKSVRGKSMFGFSFVQVTFADSVDFYWARSRVAEQLTTVSGLPEGVKPKLSPDATALGQVYYYVLEPPKNGMNLAELRSKQDFFIKYALQSVEGVAEVASIGGYEKQYQIEIDPDKLRYHNLPLDKVIKAVKDSNIDVSAKTVESGGMEFIVRGKGFIGSGKSEAETLKQIEDTIVHLPGMGVPLRIRDLAQVQIGPAFRLGALDLNGQESVGGMVVMRHGENPREVIQRVKHKIADLESELDGIKIHGIYDRTHLIEETTHTLTEALIQEIMITIAVMFLFLLHVRASLIVAITLPMAVLMSFIAMKTFGVDANIMSLAGIAIAIGTMVDMGIIILENIYDALAEWEKNGSPGGPAHRLVVVRDAAREVVPAVITAVATTIVSFLPVFFLTGRDYRLFTPLAWTKTYAIAASLIVAVTVVPMLCRVFLAEQMPRWAMRITRQAVALLAASVCFFVWGNRIQQWAVVGLPVLTIVSWILGYLVAWWLTREKIKPMEQNPASRFVRWIYGGRLRFALNHKALMLSFPLAIIVLGLGAWIGLPTVLRPVERAAAWFGADLNEVPGYVQGKHLFTGLKSDDWIALDEGSWFYMPSLYPAASFAQSMKVLQTQDVLIKQIPEVENVLGKIGRVDSALDPAPPTMIETYVMLKPRREWREGMTERKIWDEINAVATLTGITPASPLQPIEGRVVMLQSGIKASMAIRVYGDDLKGLATASIAVANHLKKHHFVNAGTVSPDIVMGKPYFEFEVKRHEAARYAMTTKMVNQVVAAGLGGVEVTTTVEGRERYPIQVRYHRGVRERLDELPRVPVVTHTGAIVPLERLASVTTTWGPGAINSEDARLVAHVSFSPSGGAGDLETVEAVMQSLRSAREDGSLTFPEGNFEMQPVGSFENQIKSNQRLFWLGPLLGMDDPKEVVTMEDWFAQFLNRVPLGLVPLAIVINFFLLYLCFRNIPISIVVFTAIPVSFAGGMIAVAVMGVKMNTAIWVGFIALFGIAVDDGVVMATYIQQAMRRHTIRNIDDLRKAIYEAGLKRIRPCVMTTVTTLVALVPILVSTGRGADVARAMALPVFGGMLVEPFTSFIVPTLYSFLMEAKMRFGFGGFVTSDLTIENADEPPTATDAP